MSFGFSSFGFLPFGANPSSITIGALTGSASIVVSASGALLGVGKLTGSASAAASVAALLSGYGFLAGSTSLTATASGSLVGIGNLGGSASAAASASGSLSGVGRLSGTAAVTASVSVLLTGTGYLYGSASILTFASGNLAPAQPVIPPGLILQRVVAGQRRVRSAAGPSRARSVAAPRRVRRISGGILMYAGRDFDEASPTEDEFYSFDFTRPAGNDTVASVSWSLAAVDGADASAASRVGGSVGLSGYLATTRLSGLSAGVRYRLTALATLASGQRKEIYSFVTCRAPGD